MKLGLVKILTRKEILLKFQTVIVATDDKCMYMYHCPTHIIHYTCTMWWICSTSTVSCRCTD